LMPILGPMLGMPAGEHEDASGWQKYQEYSWEAAFFAAGFLLGALLKKPVNRALNVFFRGFNAAFAWTTRAYGRVVAGSLRACVVVLLIYGGLLGATYFGFTRLPVGFIPPQDKGYLLVNIELPDAASLERTEEVTRRVADIARETEGVKQTLAIPG